MITVDLIGKKVVHRAHATHAKPWSNEKEDRLVVLMAVSGNYAMVRRPRYMPYVCDVKELMRVIE